MYVNKKDGSVKNEIFQRPSFIYTKATTFQDY